MDKYTTYREPGKRLNKMGLREFLRRGPTAADVSREPARRIMNEARGRELMMMLASEFRYQGDSTVIVEENKNDFWKDIVTLRWDLKPSGAAASRWQSKGVRLAASAKAIDVEVENGWYSLETKINLVSQFRNISLPKPLDEMSLEEKVRTAMELADYGLDFRYGEGGTSAKGKPVTSRNFQRIF